MNEYTPDTEEVRDFWATNNASQPTAEGYDFVGDREDFDRWLAQHDEEIVARTLLALAKPLHVELTAALDNNSTGYVFEDYPGGGWRTWVSDARKLINGENE